jgi:hypothetical protein
MKGVTEVIPAVCHCLDNLSSAALIQTVDIDMTGQLPQVPAEPLDGNGITPVHRTIMWGYHGNTHR